MSAMNQNFYIKLVLILLLYIACTSQLLSQESSGNITNPKLNAKNQLDRLEKSLKKVEQHLKNIEAIMLEAELVAKQYASRMEKYNQTMNEFIKFKAECDVSRSYFAVENAKEPPSESLQKRQDEEIIACIDSVKNRFQSINNNILGIVDSALLEVKRLKEETQVSVRTAVRLESDRKVIIKEMEFFQAELFPNQIPAEASANVQQR